MLLLILLRGELVTPSRRTTTCRDPLDDKFLEVAVSGKAGVIISGDEDLIALGTFEGIPIVRPAVFLEMLEQFASGYFL